MNALLLETDVHDENEIDEVLQESRKGIQTSLKGYQHNQGRNDKNTGKTITEEISKTGGVSFAFFINEHRQLAPGSLYINNFITLYLI